MILISGNRNLVLAREIALQLHAPFIVAKIKKFGDGECSVQIEGHFRGEDVIIVHSTESPVNDNIMVLLLMADAVRQGGARSITAVVPYLCYSRQDKSFYSHEAVSMRLVARLIEAAGIDRLITLDLHSKHGEDFFRIPVKNMDASSIFLPVCQHINHAIIVSPDLGGVARAKRFADKLGFQVAVINKSRTQTGECMVHDLVGEVQGKDCMLVDDILGTGGTLCKAALLLLEKGAKSVSACVTHAVCSGSWLQQIDNIPFSKIYLTDSIYRNYAIANIDIVSIKRSLIEELSGVSIPASSNRVEKIQING